MEATAVLSDTETALYNRQGYLALKSLCPPEEVELIRATLMGLFESRTGYEEGAQYDFVGRDDPSKPARFPSMHDPRHYAPELVKTAYFQRALALARQLLGENAALYGEHALLKPGLAGPETPWHQDEAFRSPDFEYKELSIWLALQPVTAENGCMQFIPGSNKYEVLEHRSPGGDKALHPLECCADFPRELAVPAPLEAGDCTVHHMRTLHYTAPNTSPTPRLAYILIFNTPPVYKPGRREFPWLEGRWTDSQTRRKLWHKRGGLAIDVMRRLPSARLTSPRWVAWAAIRAVNKVWKSKPPAPAQQASIKETV
ncbi:MAG: phytanoyl-CoA dioxygenase family protein [Pigmentiphaga sp.]|uniref:phytanoyl-CoA dioxygenase family protein n=1 Tax=Pigmentiphaga sp. TaxID=1977564 RepID=UPI0029BBC8ED|nr:phytanoyl-CoA dioxygenase family protein [Pigmentiphaga sp.]MDX3905556.1 phytanoyl-CoA dioxygenase family protein [Pigmentiphaga sp.]